jgi:hypothetical protein
MKRTSPKRRGFALTTAILMIGFVAAATLAVTMLVSADARRTLGSAEEAQLRQLLTAGALDAQARLLTNPSASSWALALPTELSDVATVNVTLLAPSDDASVRDAQVRATLGARHFSQTIRFRQGTGKWTAVEAHLGE